MKVTINEKNKNPLLGRTEVSGVLDYEGATPSNTELAEYLAKEFKVDSTQVVMKSIYPRFSQQMADFSALIYDNQEAKDKVERTTKHLKKQAEEAGKKATEEAKKVEEEKKAAKEEKPAEEVKEEPAEEKPAEEVKEEPAEEVKEESAKEEIKPEVQEESKEENAQNSENSGTAGHGKEEAPAEEEKKEDSEEKKEE